MHAPTLFASLATAALLTLADAHGIVSKIEVAGQTFESPLIGASGDNGPFYVPSDNSPITDVASENMFCGSVATQATSTPAIDLSQGNTISFYWESGYSTSNWPHNTGPIFLYMAKCDGDCTSQTASSTNFIKIEQQGFVNGVWAQATLNSGSPVTFTIPSDIASGNYLIRHEIINLASTDENFPACSQFAITGGSNTYSSAQTAQFPGAYSASDAGLADAGSAIYSVKTNAEYTFPGPDPVLSSDGSDDSSSGSASASASSSTSAVTSTNSVVTATSASSGSSSSTGAIALPSSVRLASASVTLSGATSSVSSSDSTATTAPAVSSSSSTSSSDVDTCATQWTTCNAVYMSASASGNSTSSTTSYNCQTEYVNCVAQVESASASSSSATPVVSSRAFAKHLRRHHSGVSRLEFH
ncbi:glycosyl hydrolase family 61-domain-containing protein [Lentinula aff. detonsa]|uniref:lytic cellulose monooxygenase (C4-dehydrogenating) n=1 Tax=Lentinula aff. detonsa TaxID=2804958 RepID=A0AA38NJ59_9AGAR|nr:glycosyl hydrolase family 61-domain-containing protein [Lentinula aff. detonsa]